MPMSKCDENSLKIDDLPNELILTIFKFLPLESILTCENVSLRWKKLARDRSLWKDIVIVYSGKAGQSEVNKFNMEVLTTHSDAVCCVKLQYVYDYSFILSVLHNCENLFSLELVMCRVSGSFAGDLKKWPKLRKLNLKNSLLFQNVSEMLIEFDNFKSLMYLALADFGLSNINCSSLFQCIHLSHIFIEKIKCIHIDNIKNLILVTGKILKSFHIYGGTSVDDKCLHLLAHCENLTDLAIIRCENLTDEGLISLVNLRSIKHLQLWNNNNFNEMNLLRVLGNHNLLKLNSLSLSRITNISPVIVDVISEYYKDLKFLALYQCPKIVHTDYEKQLKSKFRNIDVVLY